MAEFDGNGIDQMWRELQGSGLWLLGETADDVSFQRSLPVTLMVDLEELRVSPESAVLRTAARRLLASARPEEVMRVALHFAFACEIAHRPWSRTEVVREFHSVTAAEPDRQWLRNRAELLVVPQMARVIGIDAACLDGTAGMSDSVDQSLRSPMVCNFVAAFLPSVVNGRQPSPSEIRTAIWLLYHDSPFEIIADGGPSMLMAQVFGMRTVGEPHLAPGDWVDLVDMRDDHRHGNWPSDQAPSVLRAELLTASGLMLQRVAIVVLWMVDTMLRSQDSGNELWTLPTLAERFREKQRGSAQPELDFIAKHLVVPAEALREELLSADDGHYADDPDDAEQAQSRALERRKQIEQTCVQRPFVQFDDGSIIPVGLDDVAYRTTELCMEPHNGQTENPNKRRQRLGGLMGHCFEAKVRDLCHNIHDGHFAIDSAEIDEVVDREAGKRADVVVGDVNGNYLVVEATKRGLSGGIRYADPDSLEDWVDVYLGKHEQAVNTARHLGQITTDAGYPAPTTVTTLVVGDLVLPQNIALSVLFNKDTDKPEPPFLCSLTEFKQLVKIGRPSVPLTVREWQDAGTDESMIVFLHRCRRR